MIIKNILLTGASSGIGEALALYYAQQNTTENIFICGRNEERLNSVKNACQKLGKAKIHTQILDVTNKEATSAWINKAEATAPLNLVFANAGVATLQEIPDNIFNTFEYLLEQYTQQCILFTQIFTKSVKYRKCQ